MGIQIDKGARFLGIPMVKARNVLKAWHSGASRNASDIASRSDVKLSVPETMMLLQEFVERGLTETALRYEQYPSYGFVDRLSEAGRAFVSASGRKRTDREKAQGVLEDLLRRCDAVSNDPEAPHHVDRVWVYGSMLGNSHDVGDIDIVLTKKWSPKYEAIANPDRRLGAAQRYARDRVPRSTLHSTFGSIMAAETLFMRSVFGDKKHPLLSIGSEAELARLACRCRLVYDSERGGRVHDPAIDKHPYAGERDPSIGEPLRMPELPPSSLALRPLSVDWLPHLEIYLGKNADLMTFPADHELCRLNIPAQGQCRFVSSKSDLKRDFKPSVLYAKAGVDDLDGTGKSLLVLAARRDPPSLVVKIERSVDDQAENPSYAMDMKWHVKRGAEPGQFINAVEGLMALAGADVVRLSRRLSERGYDGPVKVRFNIDGDDIEQTVRWSLYHTLVSGSWLSAMPDGEFGRLDIGFSTPDGPIVLKGTSDEVEDAVGPAP